MLITASLCNLMGIVPKSATAGDLKWGDKSFHELCENVSSEEMYIQVVNKCSGMLMKVCDDLDHMDTKAMQSHDEMISTSLHYLFIQTLNFAGYAGWSLENEMAILHAKIQRKKIL